MFVKKVGGVCEVPCDPGCSLRRWEGFVKSRVFIKKVGGVCEVPCDPGCSLRRWKVFVKSYVIQGMN